MFLDISFWNILPSYMFMACGVVELTITFFEKGNNNYSNAYPMPNEPNLINQYPLFPWIVTYK